jgi:hypothetical protein
MTLRLHVESFRVIYTRPSRGGGKPAASRLIQQVPALSKKAKLIEWMNRYADEPVRTMGATMAFLNMSRNDVRNTLKRLHRDHGLGYSIRNNELRLLFPPGCNFYNVIRK